MPLELTDLQKSLLATHGEKTALRLYSLHMDGEGSYSLAEEFGLTLSEVSALIRAGELLDA